MKKKWMIAAGVVVLLLGIAFFSGVFKKSAALEYREVAIKRGDLAAKILATGSVAPQNRLEIKSPVSGRVDRVLVEEGQWVKQGQVLAWVSSIERAALIDAARAQGPEEIKHWEELYKPTPIMAPITGTLILRNIESGQTFGTNDAILVMADRLIVKAQVDETDIASIRLKQDARIELDAYPGQAFEARVDQIAFDARTINNVTTYIVDVVPNKTPAFMRSGMTANVTFTIRESKGVLLAPSDAIRSERGKNLVWVKDSNSQQKGAKTEREVTLGDSDGKRVEVQSGLAEGDVILVQKFSLGEKKNAGSSPFSPSRPRGGAGGPPR